MPNGCRTHIFSSFFVPFAGILALGQISALPLANAESKVDLKSFSTHGRLSIQMDEGVRPVWKSTRHGFELLLPGVDWTDLGVEASKSARTLYLKDTRLSAIHLASARDGHGLVLKGTWTYPKGPAQLAFPVMESFDYRQSNPPRYVVDFWYKKGPTLRAHKRQQVELAREQSIQRAIAASKSRVYQRKTFAKKVESTSDPLRFCREPFNEQTDVLIPFRPAVRSGELARWIPTQDPDNDYPYFVSAEEGLEHETIRLAHALVKDSKPALALKTVDFYMRDFSKTPHSNQLIPEMKFLKGNILLKLQMHKQAEAIFQLLMVDHKTHPVSLHSGLYMAALTHSRGEPLAALEHFMWLIRNHGTHALAWAFHFGAAESLYAMRQTERASQEYQFVLESKAPERVRVLASQRLGDLFMERQQYEQALAAYFRSTRAFPKGSEVFPEIALNRAETLLGLGEFDRARSEYERFVSHHPSFPSGWRAKVRLGELAARKGQMREAETWYRRTINEHPSSGGAVLAQLRVMACGDHGGLNLASANHFFEHDAEQFPSIPEKSQDMFLEAYGDLLTLTKLRTWLAFEDYHRVLDFVLQNLDRTKPPVVRDRLAEAFRVAFRQQALRYLNSGKPFESIAFYQEYGTKIPVAEKTDVELSDVFLRMAHIASGMEMGSMAEKLLEHVHPGRMPASDGDLAQSQSHFLKAKSLWMKENSRTEVMPLAIREELIKIQDESPYSGEREWMLAAMEERSGNLAQAIHHLSKASILLSRERVPTETYRAVQIRLKLWLADLHAKAGGRSTARDIAQSIRKQIKPEWLAKSFQLKEWSFLPLPQLGTIEEVLTREAEWFEQDGLWLEASKRYQWSLEQGFANNKNLYLHARALSRADAKANSVTIEEQLKKIAASKEDDFWKKLALEALANNQVQGGTL